MIKNEITAVNKDKIKPHTKMYQVGPALSKLVNCIFTFTLAPLLLKRSVATRHVHLKSFVVSHAAMPRCMGPLFQEQKGRFENTMESGGASVHCESLICGSLDFRGQRLGLIVWAGFKTSTLIWWWYDDHDQLDAHASHVQSQPLSHSNNYTSIKGTKLSALTRRWFGMVMLFSLSPSLVGQEKRIVFVPHSQKKPIFTGNNKKTMLY